MRAGTRPYPKYPSKESRIADTSGMFDDDGDRWFQADEYGDKSYMWEYLS